MNKDLKKLPLLGLLETLSSSIGVKSFFSTASSHPDAVEILLSFDVLEQRVDPDIVDMSLYFESFRFSDFESNFDSKSPRPPKSLGPAKAWDRSHGRMAKWHGSWSYRWSLGIGLGCLFPASVAVASSAMR